MDRPHLRAAATLRFLLLGLLGWTGLSASVRAAYAQTEDPEKLIAEGVVLRRQSQNEEAARLFQRAYELTRSPRAVAHLGTAEYDVRRFLEAEVHLAEALQAQGDPWIEARRRTIQETLDRTRAQLGWLEVTGSPAGAEVEVAGRAVGRLPLQGPIRLERGEIYLRVSAEGYESFRRSVLVTGDRVAKVNIDLGRAGFGPAGGGQVREQGPGGGPPLPGAPGGGPGGAPRPPGGRDWRWPAAWISAGAAVLFAGTGVAFLLVRDNKVEEFNQIKDPKTNESQCSTGFRDNGGQRCSTIISEVNKAQNRMVASFVGAGAAAVLAVVFFATTPSPVEEEEETASAFNFPCAPDLAPGKAGATCRFRF